MSVHTVHHFNLRAPADELRALRDFYRDVLGFTEGPRPLFRSKGHWLYVDDIPLLHLTEMPDHEQILDLPKRQSAFDHIAFCCSDLEATIARLRAHGIDFATDEVPLLGQVQLFLRDPSGVGIELNFDQPARR